MLVLDDNQRLRDKFKKTLIRTMSQSTVVCVSSSDRLMDEYTKEHADIVFIRLGNTAFNGLSVASELRELDARVNLVFISASREYALYAFRAGAANYLLEPIDSTKLNDALFQNGVSRLER
jgi:two-component SAPR family response regulator